MEKVEKGRKSRESGMRKDGKANSDHDLRWARDFVAVYLESVSHAMPGSYVVASFITKPNLNLHIFKIFICRSLTVFLFLFLFFIGTFQGIERCKKWRGS